jgi:hypothetical protein
MKTLIENYLNEKINEIHEHIFQKYIFNVNDNEEDEKNCERCLPKILLYLNNLKEFNKLDLLFLPNNRPNVLSRSAESAPPHLPYTARHFFYCMYSTLRGPFAANNHYCQRRCYTGLELVGRFVAIF